MAAYNVEWKDLYPDHHTLRKPAFIDIRNELFHTGSRLSVARLHAETLRIRALATKLLLRLLNWTGDIFYPPDHRYMYLRTRWGDEER